METFDLQPQRSKVSMETTLTPLGVLYINMQVNNLVLTV